MQCAAGCCRVLQGVAVCCSVLQCVAVCCSVLQCVAGCCRVLQCVAVCCGPLDESCPISQCAAVCCSVYIYTHISLVLIHISVRKLMFTHVYTLICIRILNFLHRVYV